MFLISLFSAILGLSIMFFLVVGGAVLGFDLIVAQVVKPKKLLGVYLLCFAFSTFLSIISFDKLYDAYLTSGL